MSLAGRRILVARAGPLNAGLVARLQDAGARAEPFPVIDIRPDAAAIAALPGQLATATLAIFVSPAAIDLALPVWCGTAARLATVGASSARRLAAGTGSTVLHPEHGSDSAALLALPALQDLTGQTVLLVKGEGGNPALPQQLRARGARLVVADLYRRVDGHPDWDLFDRLAAGGQLDALVPGSTGIVERMFYLAGSSRTAALQCQQYCVPHPRIAECLAARGVTRILTTRAGDDALVDGLKEWFDHHP